MSDALRESQLCFGGNLPSLGKVKRGEVNIVNRVSRPAPTLPATSTNPPLRFRIHPSGCQDFDDQAPSGQPRCGWGRGDA